MDSLLNTLANRHAQGLSVIQPQHSGDETTAGSDGPPVLSTECAPQAGDGDSDILSPTPTYYYSTIALAPGETMEDYNVVATASPFSSAHRTLPPSAHKDQ